MRVESLLVYVWFALDDLIARVDFTGVASVDACHVVVIHTTVDAVVTIETCIIDVPLNDASVDLDVVVTIVDVDSRSTNGRTAACNPTAAAPAVIVNAPPAPVAVMV